MTYWVLSPEGDSYIWYNITNLTGWRYEGNWVWALPSA